jgi:hypothetical protein
VGSNNPFEVIFALTAIMLLVAGIVVVVAPAFLQTTYNTDGSIKAQVLFGQPYPQPPGVPQLQDINNAGNQTPSATWAFSEMHGVTQWNTVKFASFNPPKQVAVKSGWVTSTGLNNGFTVERDGVFLVVPYQVREPVVSMAGIPLEQNVITLQQIIDAWNGSYSTFNVDPGNGQYQCFISFSPLPGTSSMQDSWNNHQGFQVWLYGNAYGAPTWMDEVSAYLTFGFQLIAYFILYGVYIFLLMGVFGAFLHFNIAITGGVMVLVIIICGGSILMFIRGNSGSK